MSGRFEECYSADNEEFILQNIDIGLNLERIVRRRRKYMENKTG